MNEKTILPLMNTAFAPGDALKTVESFKDKDIRNIAQAELYYFSNNAQACSDIAELYLASPRIELRLSACILYVYSNLTLGNTTRSKKGLQDIHEYLKQEQPEASSRLHQAYCVFASYLSAVLLHLPTDEFPDMKKYMTELPYGLRIYAAYIMAHAVYLEGDYGRALGICQSALFFSEKSYPIAKVYLYCMIAICEINRKNQPDAQKALLLAWDIAKKDKFLRPFIEHHGLFQGLLEACIRKEEPALYKEISDGVLTFSRGWMIVHNSLTQKTVTDSLSTMEFSIAMLACRGWTNQEIATHLEMSVNTIKHYLSTIFLKLGIKKREELKDFLLK